MDDPSSYSQIPYLIFNLGGVDINLFTSDSFVSFFAILVLLICSGLISASEVAFFSLEQKDLQSYREAEGKLAKTIIKLTNDHKRLLATILIFNNLINIGIVVISTLWFASAFVFHADYVEFLGLSISSTGIQFTIQVIIVTFLLLLFGEIIPKIFATQNREAILKIMAFPISFLSTASGGLTKILIGTSNLIDHKVKPKSYNLTVNELSKALELTDDSENSESEQKILEGIIRFGNTTVKQIMTSRVDVTAFEEGTEFSHVIKVISETGFSRIPVYKNTFDNITGILYIKDLLPHIDKEFYDWESLLRTPMFVPESKMIDDLLKEFQTQKMHLAIVVDEYGGASGVISLEDILEEIVGDINDEFDDDDLVYSKLDDNNYVFEGKTSLIDIYKVLEIDGSEFDANKGDSDTLAGFVIEIAERIPQKNEKIHFDRYTFVVEAADKRRIKRIKLTIKDEVEQNENN